MADKVRVLIADDHPVVRQGLAVMLEAQADMELVGEAVDGEQAVRLAKELRPNVLVLDLKMPGKSGLEVIGDITREAGATRVIVLAGAAEDEQIRAAVSSGALGFLLKDALEDQVIESIRAVHQGSIVMPPTTAQRLLREGERVNPLLSSTDPLTPRELEILRLVAQGMSNQEIATHLVLTRHTVMTHVRNILHKLRVTNRTRAAMYARDRGLT